MPDWIDQFQREWPVIAQAPWSFALAFVLLFGIMWYGFSKYYRHSMEMKDDTIVNLERKLEHGPIIMQPPHTMEEPKSLSAGEIFPYGI